MSDQVTRHPKGTATSLDLEAVARAFGFDNTAHLNAVAAGHAPSALVDARSRTWTSKRKRVA